MDGDLGRFGVLSNGAGVSIGQGLKSSGRVGFGPWFLLGVPNSVIL